MGFSLAFMFFQYTMISTQISVKLKCTMQVVVDEEQFKVAGRKLAAHLADPEVEVRLTAITVSLFINLGLESVTDCEICPMMMQPISSFLKVISSSNTFMWDDVSRGYMRRRCHLLYMHCCSWVACVKWIQRHETIQ